MSGVTGLTSASNMLKLIYTAVAWAGMADNAASSPATNIAIAAHTADPGTGGSQTTNETSYTSYARVNVPRTTSGWTVTSNSVSPNSVITFPACTGGTATLTHISSGFPSTGVIIHTASISPSIAVASPLAPQCSTGSAFTIT